MLSVPLRKTLTPLKNSPCGKYLQKLASRNFVPAGGANYQRSLTELPTRTKRHHQILSGHSCTVRFHQMSATSPVISPDNIIRSRHEDIEIPNVSLVEYIFSRIDSRPQDSIALINGTTGQSFTFAQLKASIRKVASALTRLGYKKGDTVCLFSPNVPEFCIMFLAVSAIGGIVTTANPLYSAKELAHQLKHSQSVAVVTREASVDLVKEASSSQPAIKEIIVLGEAEGCRPFSSLLEDDGKAFPENVDIDPGRDMLVLPYSSGTTGLPKGVMLSHRNIVSNVVQHGAAVPIYTSDCLVGVLPFFHIYGMVIIQFGALRDGCPMVTLSKFDPKEFLSVMEKYRVSVAPIVPPIALYLSKHESVANYDLSSLRMVCSGAAPLGEGLQHELSDRLKVPNVLQGYGLTEASPVTHCDHFPPKFGTVGMCLANTEAKVLDIETGGLLGPGEEGELCVRGPQVMMGYLDNPQATQDTIRDGWLHTGDICHYDENGYFTVTDRLKELIKYKGFQVPPAELEALLISHPEIDDAAVIGVPDDHAGELPRAYIVTAKDSSITEADINQFVDSHVSPYKKLRGGIEFLSQIPKSPSGKILRRLLRKSQ